MKKWMSWMLSLALAVTLCLSGSSLVFAETEDPLYSDVAMCTSGIGDVQLLSADHAKALGNGQTITAQNINTAAVDFYETPQTMKYTTYEYTVKMPEAGTLAVVYIGDGAVSLYNSAGSYVSPDGSTTLSDGTKVRYYTFSGAASAKLQISVYASSSGGNAVAFQAGYAPSAAVTVPVNGKAYCHGNTKSNITTFKVNVPAAGYLTLTLGDGVDEDATFSIYAKTTGFSDYVSFNNRRNVRWIGVKKGTYTVTVKSSYTPIYGVKASFTKVAESKYGAKKSKAKKIKKKKVQKGLMITGGQKAHWYKFKNPKTQKVSLALTTKLSATGNIGGIRIIAYSGKQKTSSILWDDNGSATIKLFNKGKKLKKGTYYIKVESYNKGTGYYTLKWK